jgi:hypothetical protein
MSILFLSVLAGATPPEPPPMLSIDRTSNSSLLEEQRGLGPPLHDFPKRYEARPIEPETMVAMQTTKAFVIEDAPVFWLAAARDAVVVDERWFSDLACVHATGLDAGQRVAIGHLKKADALKPIRVAEMLIVADVILTWAHIGSELKLVRTASGDTGWSGDFQGTHTYFTNEKNIDPVSFRVHIASDGALSVEGR